MDAAAMPEGQASGLKQFKPPLSDGRWNNPKPWFLSKLTTATSGCMEWSGSLSGNGYGKVKFKGKQMGAHVFSWIIHNGEFQPGLMVLHKCDNRKCCNPDHLFIGTHAENMKDGVSKKRFHSLRGEDHPKHKLTKGDVEAIRMSTMTQYSLAALFEVNQSTIQRIKSFKRWRNH
jgi:hypothetical protein